MQRNPKRSRLPALAAALALAAVVPPPAEAAPGRLRPATAPLAYHAQVPALHPNLARGLDLGTRYDTDGSTAVNLFNGDLLAALSLGQVYPVDARLSYQLVLHYNSHVWDFEGSGTGALGRPVRLANAGLGFDLSLGRLLAPGSGFNATANWLYVAPDGSPHLFYSDLHHDTPDLGDSPADTARYTRDGTYLRLRTVSAAEMRVEQPDGTWRVFAPAGGEWRLTRLSSPSGDGVDVAYAADGWSWTLTDSHGRVQSVTFMADPTGQYPRLVDRVELSAFGGARAVWDFTYATAAVPRDCSDLRGGSETVPLLASITDPVGQVQTLEYHTAGCTSGGRLRRLKLATGGFLEWTYGAYSFPPFDCGGTTPGYFRTVAGVASRKKVQPDGTVAGTWTYAVETDAAAGAACGMDGRRTVVTSPVGDRTVHHFAVGTLAQTAGGPALYALPSAPTRPDATGQLNLAEEVYDCAAGGGSCVLLRTTWQRWTQDQSCSSATGLCFDTNRRLNRSRVVYEDDAPPAGDQRFVDTAYSDYDGLGHYRTAVRTSNFGKADARSTTHWTNSEAGSYPPGKAVVFTVPALTAPWTLDDETFAEVVDEAGVRVRTDFCYAANGALLRSRRRAAAAAPSAHDAVTVHSWHGGQMAETSFYGGDVQSLGTDADLCALPLPAQRFAVQREHQHGAVAREVNLDANGVPLPFYVLDRDVDRDTGQPATSRDTAGLATVHERDLLGRVVWEKPAEGAWTQNVYDAPTGGSAWNSGPRTTVYRRPQGGGTPLQTITLLHDVFGRRTGEWTSQPGGVISGRRFQFNAQGWKTSESTAYQAGNPGTLYWMQYLNHDPFGRPRTVRPPEGTAHDETYVYRGDREVVQTSKAAKAYVGITGTCYEDTVTATTLYDGQLRPWLRRVQQPQPLPGRSDETETAYTPTDRVRSEISRQTVASATRETSTEHLWDGRGFLLATSVREGSRLVSAVESGDFDARGLAGSETTVGDLHPSPGVAVVRTWDSAGRLVSVADAAVPSKLWKQFVYGQDNSGSDRRLGRLVQAVRHNYFESAHHTVTESYVYAGRAGRVSEKTLAVATVSSASVELRMDKSYRQTAAYDDLGDASSVGFPVCLACSPGEPQAPFVLNPVFSQGMLTSLAGTRGGNAETWLTGVTWGLAGRPQEVVHANGLRDVYDPDPQRLPRPSAVKVLTAAGAVRFDSGTIVYDGAGNRCGAGNRSLIVVPHSDPTAATEAPDVCEAALRVDPFGQWNGEITNPSCQGDALSTMRLYDAFDRPVAALNRSAVKPLDVQGLQFWVADPENFIRQWRLYGIDGRLQTEVEDRASLAWRARRDFVHALGDLQGKAIQTPANPGFVQFVHKHPMGVRNTGPNGSPLASEL